VKKRMGKTLRRAGGQGPILPGDVPNRRQQQGFCIRVGRDAMQGEMNAPTLQTAERLTPLTFTVHLGYR